MPRLAHSGVSQASSSQKQLLTWPGWPQTQENCKTEACPPTQAQVSQTCACELLPYIEENLFPYIEREIYFPLLRRGGWTDRGVIGSGLRSVPSDRNVASNLTALSLGIGPQRSLRCLPGKACTPDTESAMAVTPADLEV